MALLPNVIIFYNQTIIFKKMKIIFNAKTLKRQQQGRKYNFMQNFTTTSVLKLGHFDSIHLTLSKQYMFIG